MHHTEDTFRALRENELRHGSALRSLFCFLMMTYGMRQPRRAGFGARRYAQVIFEAARAGTPRAMASRQEAAAWP